MEENLGRVNWPGEELRGGADISGQAGASGPTQMGEARWDGCFFRQLLQTFAQHARMHRSIWNWPEFHRLMTSTEMGSRIWPLLTLLGNGDGTFLHAVIYQTGFGSAALVGGDFNGAGFLFKQFLVAVSAFQRKCRVNSSEDQE